MPRETLDNMLADTKKDFVFKKGEMVSYASGWGALENERRAAEGMPPISEHLDFGTVGDEQSPWMHLLKTGYMPETCSCEAPKSYMIQDEWFEMLKKAVKGADTGNWETWMHLGLCYYWRNDFERAENCFEKSLSIKNSAWGLYCLANTMRSTGRNDLAATTMAKAAAMRPCDISLAKEALATLNDSKDYKGIAALVEKLDPSIYIGKVKYYKAAAIAYLGDIDTAEEMLLENGGMEIPDIREGEISTSDLWVYIQKERARRNGEVLNDEDIKIPYALDFRMNASK